MGILEKLNNLKAILKDMVNKDLEKLPEELKPEVKEHLSSLRETANNIGTIIEKYYRDKKNIGNMITELRSKMNEIDIYKGLSDKQKNVILDRIVEDGELNLLTKEDLENFIADRLKSESVDGLIKKAYSKKDIMKLGESVNPLNSNEIVNYDSGFSILQDMVKTPTGRKDALGHGVKRLMDNINTMHHYMMLYFGV